MDPHNVCNIDSYTSALNRNSHPKTVTLRKDEYGFGFTLRHFIVYPPTNLSSGQRGSYESDQASNTSTEWRSGDSNKPMDTIFIREVKDGSPAHRAGLVKGDRIIAINNHSLMGKTYSDIIQLILESGVILQLLVVPKEDDILQLYFASSAYEPVNRECHPGCDEEMNCISAIEGPRRYLVKKNKKAYDSPPSQRSPTNDSAFHHQQITDYREKTQNTQAEDQTQSSALYSNAFKHPVSPQSFHAAMGLDLIRSSATNAACSPLEDTRTEGKLFSEFLDFEIENQSVNDNCLKYKSVMNPSDNLENLLDATLNTRLNDIVPEQNDPFSSNQCNSYNIASNISQYVDDEEGDTFNNISSINLVAQRRHQFESGSVMEESLQRMKMYRSELSRMSRCDQSQIVSMHTAHFETLTSPQKIQSISSPLDGQSILDQSDITLIDSQEVSEDKGLSLKSPYKDVSPSEGRVVYRQRSHTDPENDECQLTRRISYLRATADDRMYVHFEQSSDDESHNKRKDDEKNKDDKLLTSSQNALLKSDEYDSDSLPEMSNSIYGWLICKVVSFEGKRSSDRSWRHVWAILRNSTLYLLKERREPHNKSLTNEEHVINVTCSATDVANDYIKRKNVLRLKLTNGTEYLMQAESHSSMLQWLKALRNFEKETHRVPDWTGDTSVLAKAAAYEQRILSNKTSAIAQQITHPMKKLVFWYRSPSEHSAMFKARRSSHGDELALSRIGLLWCDRMVHGWKKVQGSSIAEIPKGASIGVRIEDAPAGSNEHIPLLVELCVSAIEKRGLDIVGIYRIPGNNAAVSLLSTIVNQGLDEVALQDSKWNDVNVVSSLLKAFFRKLPEPLLTTHLYPKFIAASKIETPNKRLEGIKNILQLLPVQHYETLKFLMRHLKKVVDHSHINKMEARNLAIVFGPTLVRMSDNNMVTMVTDMSHQCHLIETMITCGGWLFNDSTKYDSIREKRTTHPNISNKSENLFNAFHKARFSHEESLKSSPSHGMLSDLPHSSSQNFRPRARNRHKVCKSKRSGIIEQDSDSDLMDYFPAILPSEEKATTSDLISTDDGRTVLDQAGKLRSSISEIEGDGSSPSLDCGRDVETSFATYNQLSSFAQQKVKKFELETRAMLKREVSKPVACTKAGHVEWERIEKEWQKAKSELEEEDFLDHLADDPLFLSLLLSRQDDFPVKITSTECSSSQEKHLSTVTDGTPETDRTENKASAKCVSFQTCASVDKWHLDNASVGNLPIRKSSSTSTFSSISKLNDEPSSQRETCAGQSRHAMRSRTKSCVPSTSIESSDLKKASCSRTEMTHKLAPLNCKSTAASGEYNIPGISQNKSPLKTEKTHGADVGHVKPQDKSTLNNKHS